MNQKTINIGGKDRVINFGLKAVSEIIDHNDWGFGTLGKKMQSNPLSTTPVIIYYGAKNGAEANGLNVDFTLNDVYGWIQDKGLSNPELIGVITAFSESIVSFINDLRGDEVVEDGDDSKKK